MITLQRNGALLSRFIRFHGHVRHTPSVTPRLTLANPLPRFASSGRLLKDDQIPYRWVQLARPPDNLLDPPTLLTDVLATVDRNTHFLLLVSQDPPVVKIVDKNQHRDSQRLFKEKQKQHKAEQEEKEIQLTWGAEEGDFNHRMAKVKAHLEKRHRVALVLAPKPGTRPPDPEKRAMVEAKVIEVLAPVAEVFKDSERTKRATIFYYRPKKVV